MRAFASILFFIIFASSCKPTTYSELSKSFDDDTTYTDVRRDAIIRLDKEIGLPALQKGIEGFEMRVWTPTKDGDNLNLFILKHAQGKWSYTSNEVALTQPRADKDSVHPMLRIRVNSVKSSEIKSKYGEVQFLDSLQVLELQFGPKQQKLDKGLQPDTQNYAYTFEIANGSSYRLFTYTCAEREGGLTEYDRRIQAFLHLLKSHFDIAFEDCRL